MEGLDAEVEVDIRVAHRCIFARLVYEIIGGRGGDGGGHGGVGEEDEEEDGGREEK